MRRLPVDFAGTQALARQAQEIQENRHCQHHVSPWRPVVLVVIVVAGMRVSVFVIAIVTVRMLVTEFIVVSMRMLVPMCVIVAAVIFV